LFTNQHLPDETINIKKKTIRKRQLFDAKVNLNERYRLTPDSCNANEYAFKLIASSLGIKHFKLILAYFIIC